MIMDAVRDHLHRFIVMGDDEAVLATMWTAHTYLREPDGTMATETTGRLAIISDAKESGKSELLAMIMRLAYRGRIILDPTAPGFAVSMHERKPTMGIDEMDVLFGAGRAKATLRSLLNAGYKAEGGVWERANGEDRIIFGPVALAGLKRRWQASEDLSTLRSRCAELELVRLPGKREVYTSHLHDGLTNQVRSDLMAYMDFRLGDMLECWPELPEGAIGRIAEVWRPMFQVAEVVGGHWPDSLRRACLRLALGTPESDDRRPTAGERLMCDIQLVMDGAESIGSKALVHGLRTLPGADWAVVWPHEASAQREVARMLAPFGISPVKVWDAEEQRSKQGYKAVQFAGRWTDLALTRDLPDLPEGCDGDDED